MFYHHLIKNQPMEVLNQILGKGLITPKVSCEVLDMLNTSDGGGGGAMTTNGDFWGLMGTKNHGD